MVWDMEREATVTEEQNYFAEIERGQVAAQESDEIEANQMAVFASATAMNGTLTAEATNGAIETERLKMQLGEYLSVLPDRQLVSDVYGDVPDRCISPVPRFCGNAESGFAQEYNDDYLLPDGVLRRTDNDNLYVPLWHFMNGEHSAPASPCQHSVCSPLSSASNMDSLYDEEGTVPYSDYPDSAEQFALDIVNAALSSKLHTSAHSIESNTSAFSSYPRLHSCSCEINFNSNNPEPGPLGLAMVLIEIDNEHGAYSMDLLDGVAEPFMSDGFAMATPPYTRQLTARDWPTHASTCWVFRT